MTRARRIFAAVMIFLASINAREDNAPEPDGWFGDSSLDHWELLEQDMAEQRREDRERRRERRERREQELERRAIRDWRVRSVDFVGNETFSKKELLSLMELKPRWPRYNTRFTNFLMNSDLEVLRGFYRNGGFLSAEVAVDKLERDSTSRRVRMRIAIKEGPRTQVGEVHIVAERYTPKASVHRRFATKPGRPLIRSNQFTDSRALKDALGLDGFLEARVDHVVEIDSAENVANVTFNVTEGPKAVVGNVILDGHGKIVRRVVRQELTFRPGDTLNLKTIRQSERKLYATGLFNYVQIRPEFDTARVAVEQPDSVYDVRVRMMTTDFFRLQAGVGYSTDEGARLSSSATYLNMFRLGQSLTLSGKLSQISQSAEAVYVMPRVFFMPLQFDTKVYYNRYDNAELYQGIFEGLRLSVGRQPGHSFLYQLWTQWEEVSWVKAPLEEFIPSGVPDYATQSIGADVSFDLRNDLFNPTKGGYMRLGVEVAGVFGGESNRFVKITSDNRVYFSRHSYHLSSALRTGWAMPYGISEAVPVQSKFYGGGGSTVRGFPVNKLAVMSNGDPLMGDFYTFLNIVDIRFPIYWWVNGAVFLDAGNVWSDVSEITSAKNFYDNLRWSAGPGLRIDTPIKLVARLDVGFKLDKRPGESAWELHFDLGQPF